MGFTRSWYKKPSLPPDRWKAFMVDVEKLIQALSEKAPVCRESSQPALPPTVGDALVRFNGRGNKGYETFFFPRTVLDLRTASMHDGRVFGFCKTEKRPYDLVVASVLLAAKYHFGDDILIDSDGDDEEWTEAKAICQEVLGYGGSFDAQLERRVIDG